MEQFYGILARCGLFSGIKEEEFPAVLDCLGARTVRAGKGQILFSEGDRAAWVGIVLEGACRVIREDYYGNRSIVAHIPPAGVFGESYACAGVEHLPVSVAAETDSTVLLVDCSRILEGCGEQCPFRGRVNRNLLQLVARKNLGLVQKMEILSRRTTREKLLAYLLDQAKANGSSAFTIPYDRQGLADYLQVDRSGLSSEIGKLRREGKLESDKSFFRLL